MADFTFQNFTINKNKLEDMDLTILKDPLVREFKKINKKARLDRTIREENRVMELSNLIYSKKISLFNKDIYLLNGPIYLDLKGKLSFDGNKLSAKKGLTGSFNFDTSDNSIEEYADLLALIGKSGSFTFNEAIEDAYALEDSLPMNELGQHWSWTDGVKKNLDFEL